MDPHFHPESIDRVIDAYGGKRSNLIAIMQDVQAEQKYLSQEALSHIAQRLGISVAKVYSVVTFYENFSLEAKGKYVIRICDGTACHVRKSQPILAAVREELELHGSKKTTDDQLFTLETVSCLGACGMSPVVMINEDVHAQMTPDKALSLIKEIRGKEENNG